MNPDYSKRDYLLPKGCKDLIDVLKLEKQKKPTAWQLPPITGKVLVSGKTSVRELAALLDQKPFKIIADLMGLGVFANVNQPLHFETASEVLKKYGYTAKRAA